MNIFTTFAQTDSEEEKKSYLFFICLVMPALMLVEWNTFTSWPTRF